MPYMLIAVLLLFCFYIGLYRFFYGKKESKNIVLSEVKSRNFIEKKPEKVNKEISRISFDKLANKDLLLNRNSIL